MNVASLPNSKVDSLRAPGLPAPKKTLLWSILALAAALRLAAVFWFRNFYHPILWEWGSIVHNLLTGKGYSFYEVNGVPMPSAFMPPGHALFLALVFRLLGEGTVASFVAIELINVFMGAVLAYGTFRIAQIYWSEDVALLSALLVALYPAFIYMPTEIANINFYLAINAGVVLFLAMYLEIERKAVYLVCSGALLGLLMLYRGEASALIPVISILLYVKAKVRVRDVAMFAGCCLLVIAPWAARNYVVFHRLIPTTTAMPFVLWYGHNSQANGTQRTGWGVSAQVMKPLPAMQSELDRVPPGPDYEIRYHQVFLREAVQFIRTHPGKEVALLGEKFFYYWTFDMHHPKAWSPAYWVPAIALVVMFWVGVGLQWPVLWSRYYLFVTYILFSMVLALVFHVLPRYRMFVEPLMIPFAASGLLFFWSKLSIALATPSALRADSSRRPA